MVEIELRKALALLVLLISFSYGPTPVLILTTPDKIIFQENFESYTVGSFPSSWTLWFSGAGEEYQYVTDEVSVSGSRSLKMRGADHWASCVARYFSSSASIIGYEVYVRVSEQTGYRYTAEFIPTGGDPWVVVLIDYSAIGDPSKPKFELYYKIKPEYDGIKILLDSEHVIKEEYFKE